MKNIFKVFASLVMLLVSTFAFAQTTYTLVLDCSYGPGTPDVGTSITVNYTRTIHFLSTPGNYIPPVVSNFTTTEHFNKGRQYHTLSTYSASNSFVSYEITGMSISYNGLMGAGVPTLTQLDQINTCCYTTPETVYWTTHQAEIINQSDAGATWIAVRMVQ